MLDRESRLAARIGLYQLIAVGLAGAATITISVMPTLGFGYRNAELHVALETAASLVAALAASLLYGKFRRTRMLDDLMLAAALTTLAVANVVGALTPAASDTIQAQAVWAPLWGGLVAASALAAAAFAPHRPVARPGIGPWSLLAGGALVALGAGIALLFGSNFGTGIDPAISPASSQYPHVAAAPGVLACQLTGILLVAAASVGFATRARRSRDEMLAWIALGATFGAVARLNYFLFPSAYSEWVFSGDVFRLAFYALIVVGALRQISAYERSAGELAVLEERRRIARDLHAGLAEDLALISRQATRLARTDSEAEPLALLADRALADSRGAIAALSSARDEALEVSVARLASILTHRSEVQLRLDLIDGIETSQDRREALLRVLSESIGNAVRRGSPSTLSVGLSWTPGLERAGLRLTIGDDGGGLDPVDAGLSGRLGLAGVREKVARLGGTMTVTSRIGTGTEIEVTLP